MKKGLTPKMAPPKKTKRQTIVKKTPSRYLLAININHKE
jgi:hypothetical protein